VGAIFRKADENEAAGAANASRRLCLLRSDWMAVSHALNV